jgi:ribonucleoside-triphosphate reductase (formate)
MFKKVVKRDGHLAEFNLEKITNAILKAGEATGEFGKETALKLANRSIERLESLDQTTPPTVEEIQDCVENTLLFSPYKRTAKAYIIYREQHSRIREIRNESDVSLIDDYLSQMDWRVKENSNMGYSLQGLNNYLAGKVSATYWLHKIYPNEIGEAHINADVHIHDLGNISIYCVGWDLFDLLQTGFRGVPGKLESGPAKHFRTALGQVVNFMYTMQGEAAGAIAFSNVDTLLAPYIRYDQLDEKQVKQCIQEFLFNMNVPTRVGFQTPFSNITLDLEPSPNFKNQQVMVGGEVKSEKYGEFQHEMNMFNKAFFEVMTKGDASGRVFSFPIPTVNITKDFDFDNPNLEGLWEITAKYGIPYFSNFVNSDMKPEDSRSMCCRLRLDLGELTARGGGLFGANAMTGSVGVVTINLPRLGYIAKSKEEFFELLNKRMDLAKDSLEIKRKVLEKFTDANLYPYTKFYLRKIKADRGTYWVNHFSTIGLVGLNEAALNLFGKSMGDEEGKKFGEEVLTHMRDRLISYQEETGNLYNLEATPAEGCSYRFAKADRKKFLDIKVANTTACDAGAEPYYTNSSQLPVNYTDDIFESLDLQDSLQTKYTGGTVVHLFLGEEISDVKSVPKLVKIICDNYKLPYFSITPTFSICPVHGYQKGEQHECKTCGSDCEVYSRIVGYLRPVEQWHKGKQSEYKDRKTYKYQKALEKEIPIQEKIEIQNTKSEVN